MTETIATDYADVLCVEDDDVDFERVRRAFRKAELNTKILRARDGVEALMFLRGSGDKLAEKPTLILLDLKLPRMDGFDLLKTLRSDPENKDIPVVILTSSNQTQDREAAGAYDVDGYIVKSQSDENFSDLMDLVSGRARVERASDREHVQFRLLVVEDDRVFQKAIQRRIDATKYELVVCESLEGAREALDSQRIDAAILDLALPDGKGLDLLPVLIRREIPTIVLTAHGSEEFAVHALKEGVEDYVVKSEESVRDLGKTIDNAVEKSRLRAELHKREQEKDVLIEELQQALDNVKQLEGMLPICAECKKIRDDDGFWQQVETYITGRTEASFTHGYCPHCYEKVMQSVQDDDSEEIE